MFSTTSDLPLAPHLQSFFSLFNPPMDPEAAALNLSRALALQRLANFSQLAQLPTLPYSLPDIDLTAVLKQMSGQCNPLEDFILRDLLKDSPSTTTSRKRSFPPQDDKRNSECPPKSSSSDDESGVTRKLFDETLERILDEEITREAPDDRSSPYSETESDRLSPAGSAFRKVSRLSESSAFSILQKSLSAVNIDESLLWQGNLSFGKEGEVEVPVECHFVEGGHQLTKQHFRSYLESTKMFCSTVQTPESKATAASDLSAASDHSVCVFLPSGNSREEKEQNATTMKEKLTGTVGVIGNASKECSLYLFPAVEDTDMMEMIEKSPFFDKIRNTDLVYFAGVLARK